MRCSHLAVFSNFSAKNFSGIALILPATHKCVLKRPASHAIITLCHNWLCRLHRWRELSALLTEGAFLLYSFYLVIFSEGSTPSTASGPPQHKARRKRSPPPMEAWGARNWDAPSVNSVDTADCQASATPKNASKGERHPKHFFGLKLIDKTIFCKVSSSKE